MNPIRKSDNDLCGNPHSRWRDCATGTSLNQHHLGLKQSSSHPLGQADQPALSFKDPYQSSFAEFREIDRRSMADFDQRLRRRSDRRELRQNQSGVQEEALRPDIYACFIFINIILIIGR